MMLAMKSGQQDPSAELLESFSHIVATSLRRRRAENALRESEEKFQGERQEPPVTDCDQKRPG